ncbi:inorganic pyrophosphatase [Candidatus Lucifugimonas marina]|jgi:inorganic pyrophosphatase|uniref:Inorganic pyrophosphatase n=1 Tax=Candidatus Lucifugimonas marina TaxID=3038979 RepID=A0AAJ5ZCA2_9CHLR|nr:inorganic pyrophosphatase [SAR202 cluster bacterium JH702]MDG0869968.1 inorganic pyrophosphatase [SAR202 cluster bacterium JH639]WFG34691.1 inorganic pyrophosphatase [SAR202 cluster bacterium JH545]WFG38619.1 inorganic pyrophosphatase [SAR202 cluster bacterium JH1073]
MTNFWNHLETLVAKSDINIDRPKGSRHPKNSDIIYPLDYGELVGTTGGDGDGIDIWVGTKPDPKRVEGVITTVDLWKRDAEIKILYGTTQEEMAIALETHNTEAQAAKLIPRD